MSRRPQRAIQPLCALLAVWVAVVPALGQSPQTGVFAVTEGESPVRFAVFGDTGTGERPQFEIGARAAEARTRFPFDFAILLGDNMYGRERPQDYRRKFEEPYRALLEGGVQFYAALGNHDDPDQRFYKRFNMNGERYYRFKKGDVAFFALDSNYMDPKQLAWLEKELAASGEKWKVAYFHHPLYSSGARHGSETDLRALVEPLFLEHGVSVVFAGHEHFYERLKPQKGIAHFIAGSAAKLRSGNIRKTELTAKGFDTDRAFMLVQIADDEMQFQAISRTGAVVDSGTVARATATPRPRQ